MPVTACQRMRVGRLAIKSQNPDVNIARVRSSKIRSAIASRPGLLTRVRGRASREARFTEYGEGKPEDDVEGEDGLEPQGDACGQGSGPRHRRRIDPKPADEWLRQGRTS
jgi:hypothetical protein